MSSPKPSTSERAERAERLDEQVVVLKEQVVGLQSTNERAARDAATSVEGLEKALRAAEKALRAASEKAEVALREASERVDRAEHHAVTAEASTLNPNPKP